MNRVNYIWTKEELDIQPMLIKDDTISNVVPVTYGAVVYYIYQEKPLPYTFPIKCKVSNSNGTYIQPFPRWNEHGQWVANGTELIGVNIINYLNMDWIVLDNRAGFVSLLRVLPV